MKLWLVRFMAGDLLAAGVFTEAPTFLDALDRCGHLGLIPEGTAALDEEITIPVGERWHDRLLTPAQISEALGER